MACVVKICSQCKKLKWIGNSKKRCKECRKANPNNAT